jgi:penicillin-insensitive murein endopeptidase
VQAVVDRAERPLNTARYTSRPKARLFMRAWGNPSGILSSVNLAGLWALLQALNATALPTPVPGASPTPDAGAPDAGAMVAALPNGGFVARQWQAQQEPAPGPALAIGACSRGCLQGAAVLPASGTGYEALHLTRNRRYGHPALISYLRRLAEATKAARLGPLIVGDLSQPRGGPTPSGHRSHQTGLDADLGYVAPPGARRGHLSARDRERLSPPPVVDLRTHRMTPAWRPRTMELVALAASDAAVDRIFVNPTIKRILCTGTMAQAPWQARVRPWWGHHDHFHVRLKCPTDSALCVPQEPPPDDGCGATLDWWFTPDAEATRTRRQDAETQGAEPELPAACAGVLSPPQSEWAP